ncbi:MAG: hypothetical protein M1830_006114 [Pleopsidium flavum]|nr:MAG: hypothetical protein M1830_008164 [Pleopsidium flavum]KAI9879997.1 MAG: hypothetical protein M1830_006114 [Pleopsidium flavum]
MKSTILSTVLLAAGGVLAQHNASTSNGCSDGYFPGTDTVIYSVPYTYAQVMSIIGSYKNLTWSGNPDNTVTLNGTDNTVGTARTYDVGGAHVIETITVYEKPAMGPYVEVHTLAPLTIAAANVSFYGDFDGTTVTSICGGAASTFNLTIDFCATNATLAASVLHMIHLADASTVGVFLGGQNFSSCAAMGNSSTSTSGSGSSSTMSTSAPAVGFTGGASMLGASALLAGGAALAAIVW